MGIYFSSFYCKIIILVLFGLCQPSFQDAKRLLDLLQATVIPGTSCRADREISNKLENAGECR